MSNAEDYDWEPWPPSEEGEASEQNKKANAGEQNKKSNAAHWSFDQLLEPIDYTQTLLGERFLERGGTMAMVAPSGVGKTVGAIQMAVLWAVGRPAFHIKPSGLLRILIIQNEDSMNDTKGPAQAVYGNCGLNEEQKAMLPQQLKVVRLVGVRGSMAAAEIRKAAVEWKADLIILNPLMAYVPGKQGEEIEVFLREYLQPIAVDLAAGVVAVHHTPKIGRPNGVGTGVNEYERQYNSAGRAEVTNAFRAILNIMPIGDRIFKFTADKRGRKIGWRWDNEPTIERFFKHSADPDNPDLVWWVDSSPEEAQEVTEAKPYQDILKVLPTHEQDPVSRERIRVSAKKLLKIGKNKADEWLKLVLEDKLAQEVETKTSAGRKAVLFRRANGVQEAWS